LSLGSIIQNEVKVTPKPQNPRAIKIKYN
jgi:hypothetical protein